METLLASIYFLMLISAIETLIEYSFKEQKKERCLTCKQDQYNVRQKYLTFVKYLCNNNTRNFKKYLEDLYTLRSKIVHSGLLLLSDIHEDITISVHLKEKKDQDDYWKRTDLVLIYRTVFINWLIRPDKSMTLSTQARGFQNLDKAPTEKHHIKPGDQPGSGTSSPQHKETK